jgi:3-methyladenine DNA glycosylase AlkD
MTVEEILRRLESIGKPENIAGMARFAIKTEKAYGVSAPDLKQFAREIKKAAGDRHALALELWTTRVYEARVIAYLIDNPKEVTREQMEDWAKDFDNWAICDSTCGTLFSATPFAYEKIFAWTKRNEEFVKRAGFALIAWLAVHDKKAEDEKFIALLGLIEDKCADERNFVKKAVNWALRQIGKRNLSLNRIAVESAQKIRRKDSKAARWIASDALRELTNEKTLERLKIKAK